MSIISSKQSSKQGIADPVFILVLLLLVLTILLIAPFAGHSTGLLGRAWGASANAPMTLAASKNVSFTSDLNYWNANCSHGWTTDSVCKNIAAHAQSCSIGSDSDYCTTYDSYLQQFRDR